MNSIIGDDLLQLLTEQSNLYHSQNAEKWKVSPKTLKWSDITSEEMRKLLLISEENCKMVEKSGTLSAKLCSLQHIFCVQDTK